MAEICIIETDKIVNGSNLMYENIDLVEWNSDLSSLTNGERMFYKCSNLIDFNCDNLSSLTDGDYMFCGCKNLSTFNHDLSSLIDGKDMFKYCSNLTVFTSDLSSLATGAGMFNFCSKLATFTSNLRSLTFGNYMFQECSNLTTFTSDLSSLISGVGMLSYCPKLTTFTSNLSSLTNGEGIFYGCSLNEPSVQNIALTVNKITNNARFDIGVDETIQDDVQVKRDLGLIKHKGWNLWINGSNLASDYTLPKYAGCTTVDSVKAKDANYLTNDIVNGVWGEHLPDLNDGTKTFYKCTAMTAFNGDLSSLTNGQHMFRDCSNLASFNIPLGSLTYGRSMFYDCSNLTTFTSNLSSLTNGNYMFWYCTNLTSFTGDLSSLTIAYDMFYHCTNLTTFDSDLSSLTNGLNMFSGCKLNLNSLKKIADTIKNVTSLTEGESVTEDIRKTIHIGIANSTPSIEEQGHLNRIASKGWTVGVNGITYSPTSTASIMTLDELGNEVETPIPFYAKPIPSDEEYGDYVDAEGNYYIILGAQFIYGDDLSTYGMFTCEADAAANMRLTKIDK